MPVDPLHSSIEFPPSNTQESLSQLQGQRYAFVACLNIVLLALREDIYPEAGVTRKSSVRLVRDILARIGMERSAAERFRVHTHNDGRSNVDPGAFEKESAAVFDEFELILGKLIP